jgi:hypothetical protein
LARNVREYVEERNRECEKLSLAADPAPIYAELAGSNGKRGRVVMRLHLSERAYLAVSELIVVAKDSVHREEYGYYLIIDGREYWSRDLDPVHGYHGHTIGHERVEAKRITFKQAVKEAWEILGHEEELTGTEPSDS